MKKIIIILEGNGFVGICFPDDQLESILAKLKNFIKENGDKINANYIDMGETFFDSRRFQGFYVTDANDQEFKLKEKMTKAMEKMAGSADEGETWKKPEE